LFRKARRNNESCSRVRKFASPTKSNSGETPVQFVIE
jgi:hypothetical protein